MIIVIIIDFIKIDFVKEIVNFVDLKNEVDSSIHKHTYTI